MPQANYIFDAEADAAAVRLAMANFRISARCQRWRRAALISWGLFMASAVLNLIQFLER